MAVAGPEVIPRAVSVRQALTKNWGYLMENICPEEQLLGNLIQHKALESDDRHRIMSMPSPQSQVSEMLRIIKTKGDAALLIFAQEVREGQPDLKLEELVQSVEEEPSESYTLKNGKYHSHVFSMFSSKNSR